MNKLNRFSNLYVSISFICVAIICVCNTTKRIPSVCFVSVYFMSQGFNPFHPVAFPFLGGWELRIESYQPKEISVP